MPLEVKSLSVCAFFFSFFGLMLQFCEQMMISELSVRRILPSQRKCACSYLELMFLLEEGVIFAFQLKGWQSQGNFLFVVYRIGPLASRSFTSKQHSSLLEQWSARERSCCWEAYSSMSQICQILILERRPTCCVDTAGTGKNPHPHKQRSSSSGFRLYIHYVRCFLACCRRLGIVSVIFHLVSSL